MSALALLLFAWLADGDAAAGPTYRATCAPAVFEAWSTSFDSGGATRSSHDRSTRYCFHGGRGDIAEYRSLGPDGQPVFHGASVTLWSADRGRGRTLWVMVGVDGHTDIRLRWEGSRLVATGTGHDPAGAFREAWTTDFLRGGDQHFEMRRSYDDGKTWRSPFNVIEYLKTPAAPPPLSEDWAPRFAGFAPGLVGSGGMILLDGNAWGRFIVNEADEPTGFAFASVAPEDDTWVWRTVHWSFAEGIGEVVDRPLPAR